MDQYSLSKNRLPSRLAPSACLASCKPFFRRYDGETHQSVLDLTKELVADLQDTTRIVGFFDKWNETDRIKCQIRRSILGQPFGNRALVKAVTERFMDLARVRFQ